MSKRGALGLHVGDVTDAFDREFSRFDAHVKGCPACTASTAPRDLCSQGRDLYRKLRRTVKR